MNIFILLKPFLYKKKKIMILSLKSAKMAYKFRQSFVRRQFLKNSLWGRMKRELNKEL
jgi:hypothetical protein